MHNATQSNTIITTHCTTSTELLLSGTDDSSVTRRTSFKLQQCCHYFVSNPCISLLAKDSTLRKRPGSTYPHHIIPEVSKDHNSWSYDRKITVQKIVRTLGAQNVNGQSQNETDGFRAEVSHGLRTGSRWVSGLHCDWRWNIGFSPQSWIQATVTAVQEEVMTWFKGQAADFYDSGIQKLVPRLHKFLDNARDYVEK